MKKWRAAVSAVFMTVFAAILLTACGSASVSAGAADNRADDGSVTHIDTSGGEKDDKSRPDGAATEISDIDIKKMFTDRDQQSRWSASASFGIRLEQDTITAEGNDAVVNGNTVTVTKEGTYHISGSLANGQIIVDAGEKDKVQLVLDGVDITCSTSACILVKEADKVFVTLADNSENFLSDTGTEYLQSDDTMNVDAVIFSKTDLVFNGNGSLTVNAGFHDGIVSKDDLKFTGGSYTVTAAEKGIVGKDSLRIKDGSFKIVAEDDALHTDREDKTGKGFIYIGNGDFSVLAGDDAIHAATVIIIEGGEIDISQCYEGLEGMTVQIKDGTVHIRTASGGIDSENLVLLDGGEVTIDGPAFGGSAGADPGAEILINGGSITAAGSPGTTKPASENSSQYSVYYISSNVENGGQEVKLVNAKEKTVCSFTPVEDWTYLLISSPDLKKGKYTLSAGGKEIQIDISSVSCTAGAVTTQKGQ